MKFELLLRDPLQKFQVKSTHGSTCVHKPGVFPALFLFLAAMTNSLTKAPWGRRALFGLTVEEI